MLSSLYTRLSPLAPSAQPQGFAIHAAGQTLYVALRIVSRAKRMTLRVQGATGIITLTAPPRFNLKKAHDFAQSHAVWLLEKRNALLQKIPLADGAMLPLRGQEYRIRATRAVRGLVTPVCAPDPDTAQTLFFLDVPGTEQHHARKILDFLKKEARKDLEKAAQRYARHINVTVGNITIRDTRSRWGSCSSKGDLSFSFRLIMAPPFVLDYVAAHEVAHRREMNHSARFWALLNSMTSHVDHAEAWLKTNGAALHRYI